MVRSSSKANFHGNWAQVQEQLLSVQQSDFKAEEGVRRGSSIQKKGCLLGGIAILAVLFLTQAAASGGMAGYEVFAGIGFAVCLVGVVVVLAGTVIVSRHSGKDLDNDRYEMPLKLLRMVEVDLDPCKEMSVTVDFRPSLSSAFVQEVNQAGFLFFRWGPKVTTYAQTWLTISASTAQGYRLGLEITRCSKYKVVAKRKRVKTRLRCFDLVRISVRPPRGKTVGMTRETRLLPPGNHRFRSFQGKATAQGSVIKAVGPIMLAERVSEAEIVSLLISAFRGLVR